MELDVPIGLIVAMASAVVLNWAYVQEHDAAARMPPLSPRRPLHTVRLLAGSHAWLRGFFGETGGFILYVIALAMAPLSLVQSVSAGGIAVLAFFSARSQHRTTNRHERIGVGLSLVGLIALAVSLSESTNDHSQAAVLTVAIWLGACGACAAAALLAAKRGLSKGVAYAIAAGILLSCGDLSVKAAYEGGWHLLFIATAGLGYGLGTILLQVAYQHARALTAAGISTLLINTLPIVAATTILGEQVPSGALGALRVLAFATITAGAVALARRDPSATG
jgi:hypothetical protein